MWWISLNHSMAMDRYKFKVKLGGKRCVNMFLNSIAGLCMLIMCGASKEFVEFIKGSGCGCITKIRAHSIVQ